MNQLELNIGNTTTLLLTGTRKVVIKVDYNDVDKAITTFLKSKGYVEKCFDKNGYECIAVNEWSNYQEHDYSVTPKMPDAKDLEDIGGLGTCEILCWMCAEGRVEAGSYLISVNR